MRIMIQKNSPCYILASPYCFTFLLYIPIFVLYIFMPSNFFYTSYNAEKISDSWYIMYYGVLLIVFGIGGYIGSNLRYDINSKLAESTKIVIPRWYIRGGMLISLLAYILWFILGIYRSDGIKNLIMFWLCDPFYVKSRLLKTVPGVTTLTQVAVAAIPIMICCQRASHFDYFLSMTILTLATIRSFIFGERLALLELLIPIIFLKMSNKELKWKHVLILLLSFLIFIIIFFIVAESRRSFLYRHVNDGLSLFIQGIIRFIGYYMTSINNGIFFMKYYAYASPLYSVFSSLWHFPGLNNIYTVVTGLVPIDFNNILTQHLNPEFNTFTAIGQWAMDFGLFGVFIYTFLFGFLSGILHNLTFRNKLVRALYSIWLVGLMEFMRISYFTSTRLFPAYLFFIGAILLEKRLPVYHKVKDNNEF